MASNLSRTVLRAIEIANGIDDVSLVFIITHTYTHTRTHTHSSYMTLIGVHEFYMDECTPFKVM